MGKKSFLSFIISVHVGILYSGKFILNAEILGKNAVVMMRVFCNYSPIHVVPFEDSFFKTGQSQTNPAPDGAL